MLSSMSMYLLLGTLLAVYVNGDYVLQVRTHSYDNPTNRCVDCITTNSDTAGCCDDFAVLGGCNGDLRCDNYFYYCLRTFARTEEGCSGGQRSSHAALNGLAIDFTQDIVLGLLNPLPLDGIATSWNGVQLYLDVTDLDPGLTDDLVDRFLIDISTTNAPVGIETPRTVYNGSFGFATTELSFRVVCAENYYGPDCSRFCFRNCICDPGFTGEFCATNIDDCVGASCPENSICVDDIHSFECICNTGFTGAQCDVNVNDCVGTPCSGNGQCTDGIDIFSCTCDPGFTGEFCETNIDECLTMAANCSGNGDCVDEVNSYSCTCDPGFTGDLCEININDCVGTPCSGNGFCTDGLNPFACVCNSGFTGSLCETNINDCVGVNCSGNGQCEDGVDSFTCVCEPGFTGEQCNNTISKGIPMTKGIDVKIVAISCGLAGAVVFIAVLVVVIMVLFVVNKKHKPAAASGGHSFQDSKHIEVSENEAYGTTQQTQDDIEMKQNIVYGVNPRRGQQQTDQEATYYCNTNEGPTSTQEQPHEYEYVPRQNIVYGVNPRRGQQQTDQEATYYCNTNEGPTSTQEQPHYVHSDS